MPKETLEQKAKRISQENGLDYKNVLQGMQMGDIDFQLAIAPYSNYKGTLDPSLARYHGLTPEQIGRDRLTLKGFSVGEQESDRPYVFEANDNSLISIPKEANTVNALDRGAIASVWAHEYRHQEGTDASTETANRIIDLATAMNKTDWSKALDFIRDDIFKSYKRQIKTGSKENKKEAEMFYKKARGIIHRNKKKNPSTQDKANLQKLLKTKYSWHLENLYGVKNDSNEKYPMNNMFKKFITTDFNDKLKEEKAKTAKTFKEAL
tara:strand:- start:400 stop:1194 length:795 start_codon:yes stop_codon:yes gene_type:complete